MDDTLIMNPPNRNHNFPFRLIRINPTLKLKRVMSGH